MSDIKGAISTEIARQCNVSGAEFELAWSRRDTSKVGVTNIIADVREHIDKHRAEFPAPHGALTLDQSCEYRNLLESEAQRLLSTEFDRSIGKLQAQRADIEKSIAAKSREASALFAEFDELPGRHAQAVAQAQGCTGALKELETIEAAYSAMFETRVNGARVNEDYMAKVAEAITTKHLRIPIYEKARAASLANSISIKKRYAEVAKLLGVPARNL